MKTQKGSSIKAHSRSRGSTRNAVVRTATRREMFDLQTQMLSLQAAMQARIASDLHDSTSQYLVAAGLHLVRLRRVAKDIIDADRMCDEIDDSIQRALREIRAFTYLLYPQDLPAEGLKRAIEQFAVGFSARTSLESCLDIPAEIDRLPHEMQCSLLRVVQEALTNVYRHARATRVTIAMQATDTHFILRISDDGRGMAIGHMKTRPMPFGVGILGMRARLRQMGSVLKIKSSSGKKSSGTTLCAAIPRFPGRRRVSKASCASLISTTAAFDPPSLTSETQMRIGQ